MIGQYCAIHEPCPPSHGHGPSPAQSKAGVTRTIHHFCYLGWPDFGVPESPTGVLTMLHHVRALTGSGDPDARVQKVGRESREEVLGVWSVLVP